ncbi:MAG: hypothetical protein JSW64_13560 [Candidatus Zixiibacteriota bacterium]|nr:MAG: hypothetical protein JSW64_13560 [candidate division Zixibacteria bacterium]
MLSRFNTTIFLTLAIVVLVLAVNAMGDSIPGVKHHEVITSVPRTMTYQGILKDNAGDPVVDSVYSVIFRIFDQESGGSSLWDETLSCTTSAGYFSATFSNVSLPFDADYWLELEVDSEILTPRQKINMSAYAARSDTSDYAASGGGWVDDGLNVRLEASYDKVGIGTSTPTNKLHVTGSESVPILNVEQTGSHRAARFYSQNACALWVENAGNHGLRITNAGGRGVYIQNAGSDGIRVDNAGGWGGYFNGSGYFADSVGIGTETPQEMLDVAGTASVTGFKMPTGASDGYVLTSDGSGNGTWQAPAGGDFWSLTGNSGTVDTVNYIGTSDSTALEFRVFDYRALRLEPVPHYSVPSEFGSNLIANPEYNSIGIGINDETVYGATVLGGGYDSGNFSSGFFSAISGGGGNADSSGSYSTISGGYNNRISGMGMANIGGGANNTVSGFNATICGGYYNTVSGTRSTVAGGLLNTAGGEASIIAGGEENTVSDGWASFIGGGFLNVIDTSSHSFIGGGRDNTINNGTNDETIASFIGGGKNNTVSASNSFIGAGASNSVSGDYSSLFGVGSSLAADSTFMVDMPHIRFGDETNGYEFPTTDGASGQVMSTDGAGQLSWTDVSAGPDSDWTISGSDMYSAVSGNVGIGQSSPSEKLHITDTDTRALIQGGGNNVGIGMHFTGTSGRRYDIVSTGAGDGGAGRFKIKDITGGNDRFTIDSNGNIFLGGESSPILTALSTGNVGIGTASPAYQLELKRGQLGILMNPFNTAVPFTIEVPDNQANIISRIIRGGTVINVVDSVGNVGIGTAAPSEKLHLNDTDTRALIQGGGHNVGIGLHFTGSSGRRYDIVSTGSGDGGAGRLKIKDITLGNDRFVIDPNGNIFLGGESSPSLLAMGTGNVGIGNSNPQEKLDVTGTAQMTGFKMPTGASNGYVLTSDGSGNGTWQAASGGLSGTGTTNYISKFTGSTSLGNSLIYDSGSNIGIGTSSPTKKLTLSGGPGDIFGVDNAVCFVAKNSSGTYERYLWPRAGDNRMYILYGQGLYFRDSDGSGSTTLFLSQSGDVGVGTASPLEKLDVSGTARITGFKMPTGAAAGYVLTSDGSGNGTWQALPPGIDGSPESNDSIDAKIRELVDIIETQSERIAQLENRIAQLEGEVE